VIGADVFEGVVVRRGGERKIAEGCFSGDEVGAQARTVTAIKDAMDRASHLSKDDRRSIISH